jgi:hypothetical protein
MKKRFTETQIVGFLQEAVAGEAIKDLCLATPCPRAVLNPLCPPPPTY